MERILVLNPGSTSTKLAIYRGEEEVWLKVIKHPVSELARYPKIIDQLEWRQSLILQVLDSADYKIKDFDCLVARGGAGLDPISGGTYWVDRSMVEDLYQGKNAEHASNLAGIIVYNLGEKFQIPALTVDPVAVDEFEPLARLSGLPELPRRCQSHALNLKAVARKVAEIEGKKADEINLIGVHLGGGISVAALRGGKIIDVNNANQGGPYSPERVGSLPVVDLVNYIYQHKPRLKDLKKRLLGGGGLIAYLGSNDGLVIEQKIAAGDKVFEYAYQGMIYQIAKEVGAMSTVLAGRIAAIFITGGLAHSAYVVEGVKARVSFIAPVYVFPGAEEMKHLLAGALRVLRGEEKGKIYQAERVTSGEVFKIKE